MHGALDAMFCVQRFDGVHGEFCITEVNAPGEQLMGRPANELVGQTVTRLFSEQTAPRLLTCLTEVDTSRVSAEFELELAASAGTRAHVRLQVIPLPDGLLVGASDITEATRAQAALRDSQEYLRSVITNAPIIIYELDKGGTFKLSAGRSLGQIGLAPSEAVGGSIYDFFAEQSPEVAAFKQALQGETTSTETQLGHGYFASRYTPRYDDAGHIVGVLGVSYDVTERRQAEAQLLRAQRMEAIGQLTGGIAHDFNNLLAVVLGNLDLLAHKGTLEADSSRLVEQALAATQRGADLTRRLLAFSRRQLLEPRATDVNMLVTDMLDMLKRTFPEHITIAFEGTTGLWSTLVDPAQLENALLNLCVNARDAMPNGGHLRIATDNVILEPAEAASLEVPPGDYVSASVRDTGTGIDPDVAKMVFEPFFTTKEVGKGSGLGLSMVYGFVNQSGGAIEVDSTPDEGSCITLLLPRTAIAAAVPLPEATTDSTDPVGAGELILVVEDDLAVRQFVVDALRSLNYRTVEAGDGQTALGTVASNDEIRLVLSDMVLPGNLDGIELAKQARRLRPELRTILTTGYVGDSSDLDNETMARLEHIAKPYRIAELAQKVHRVLNAP